MNENRRGFMAALAAFFGFGAASQAIACNPVVPNKKKGFVCLYQSVGMLPPFKAEAFIERLKKQWRESDKDNTFGDYGLVVIPVRPPQETRLVLFDFENGSTGDMEEAAQELCRTFRDNTPFEAPDKQQTKDYVLLMLGAPVTKVELDDKQLDAAYDQTNELFTKVAASKGLGVLNMDGYGAEVFKNIVLAKATIMLGHIRRKYHEIPGTIEIELDGDEMAKEGNENLIYWTEYLDKI